MGEFHGMVLSSSSFNAILISSKPRSKVRVLLNGNRPTVRTVTAARDHATLFLFYNQ